MLALFGTVSAVLCYYTVNHSFMPITPERRTSLETERRAIPRHLVVIPDGNGRWAQKHNLAIVEGHLRGAQNMLSFADRIDELGIEVCTFWGFSTENWARSEEEVGGIFDITKQMLEAHQEEWVAKGRRFRHVGRKDRLPADLLATIEGFEKATAKNRGKTFVLALDYGGRDEIVRAANKTGGRPVDEETFGNLLDTAGLPRPDLIIRTSGEMRTSGIYPYHGVYAEFVSSPVLFPDFDNKELDNCLDEFARRKRRFGARLEVKTEPPFSWLGLRETSFQGFLDVTLPKINKAAQSFLESWRSGRFYRFLGLQEDVDVYKDLLTGGKKLRGALVVFGFENAGGEPEFREGVFTAAVGYEVIHNAFLIHDDIMDASPMRRGQPSVHEKYRTRHEKDGGMIDHVQYGQAVALNTGSLGPLRAQEVLWGIQNKPDRIIQAQRFVRFVIETTLLGQRRDMTDIPLESLTTKQVFEICHQKTAVYSVVGPFALGAILAGASRKEVGLINSFGVNLGISFQIIDDHLGLFGSEEVIGKPVGSDLGEAKKTLHFVKAWARANDEQRKFLRRVWGSQSITAEDIDYVRQLVEDLRVKEEVLDVARNLANKARRLIPRISNSLIAASILDELVTFVTEREL